MRIFDWNVATRKIMDFRLFNVSENETKTPSLSKLHNFGKRFDTPPLSLKRTLGQMYKNILAQREHDVHAKL